MQREEKINYLVNKEKYSFDDLVMIMELLRLPGGCPWDAEQTHKSIRNDFIEETYEAIEAIDKEDPKLLREELGDVLLQVVFHSRIEEEQNSFNIFDVTNDICAKLIHRHPHVFGEVKVENSQQVLDNWNKIKNQEKTERKTVTDKLNAIPQMLPALSRAAKVGKKAKCFDFKDADEVTDKLYEEIDEVKKARESGDQALIEEEIGDLLLTAASLSRKLSVDPEEALYHATEKFINRFSKLETKVIELGEDIEGLSMSRLDDIWNQIKINEKKGEKQ